MFGFGMVMRSIGIISTCMCWRFPRTCNYSNLEVIWLKTIQKLAEDSRDNLLEADEVDLELSRKLN
jgi:hypothetical protein